MKGIIRTRVGYAGGTRAYPTYHALGDHTEAVQIDFDPHEISYEKLLRLFFLWHDPSVRPWSRQYMSAIFYHDVEQKETAEKAFKNQKDVSGRELFTRMIPLDRFYAAEDYHQKYYLKQEERLFAEYRKIYPDTSHFVKSTAVARVNGYCAGLGQTGSLLAEIDLLGLSEKGKALLKRMVLPVSPQGERCPVSAAERAGTE